MKRNPFVHPADVNIDGHTVLAIHVSITTSNVFSIGYQEHVMFNITWFNCADYLHISLSIGCSCLQPSHDKINDPITLHGAICRLGWGSILKSMRRIVWYILRGHNRFKSTMKIPLFRKIKKCYPVLRPTNISNTLHSQYKWIKGYHLFNTCR